MAMTRYPCKKPQRLIAQPSLTPRFVGLAQRLNPSLTGELVGASQTPNNPNRLGQAPYSPSSTRGMAKRDN